MLGSPASNRKSLCYNQPRRRSDSGLCPTDETRVSIRIDLETGGRIGPGKIALLEAISKTGSITAAARSMNMSYRRAWLLVDEINKLLNEPAVATEQGGARGGGAILTPVGRKTIQLYHSIEIHTRAATRSEFQAFGKLLRGARSARG